MLEWASIHSPPLGSCDRSSTPHLVTKTELLEKAHTPPRPLRMAPYAVGEGCYENPSQSYVCLVEAGFYYPGGGSFGMLASLVITALLQPSPPPGFENPGPLASRSIFLFLEA